VKLALPRRETFKLQDHLRKINHFPPRCVRKLGTDKGMRATNDNCEKASLTAARTRLHAKSRVGSQDMLT
jgi:hypothetical protein